MAVSRRISVRLAACRSDIHVATNMASVLGPALEQLHGGARPYVLVTDDTVHRLVWPAVKRSLRRKNIRLPEPIVLASGERHKNLRSLTKLQREMLARGLDRSGVVVALGGGVVTDLAGFAAATFMRGIEWIAVPTTLLGMVDAAIGGKVGVNFQRTKNVIGAFHQPRSVLIGTEVLATLPSRERRSGMGEVVKYAMIADRRLFRSLERARHPLRAMASADATLVARCCRIKARLVEADEREAGVRAALNFGHTLGHALEGDGEHGLAHGEAVGLGMLAACALAEDLGVAQEPQTERLRRLLQHIGLPTSAPRMLSRAGLRRALRHDKKSLGGEPRFVLTPRIGEVVVGRRATKEQIERSLDVVLR